MRKLLFFILFLSPAFTIWAQGSRDSIFTYVETEPSFPGGTDSMMRFIINKVKYPPYMLENGIEGRLRIAFVVSTTGTIEASSLEVVKSKCYQFNKEGEIIYLNDCKLFEEEAKRVVMAMPSGHLVFMGEKPYERDFYYLSGSSLAIRSIDHKIKERIQS